MNMKFAISVGHGKYIRGASGSPVPPQLDEVDYCVNVVDRVYELINSIEGMSAVKFFDTTSHDQSANLEKITNWHNSQTRDYDVSCHLNAYDGSAHGTEVLYVTQQELAQELCDAICEAGDFTNRGAKYRSDLYVLNNTDKPAVLLETAFCDHTGDCNALNSRFDDICKVIAETLTGKQLGEAPERPPVVPEERSRVSINIKTKGDVVISINGEEFHNPSL
jgi:N-acetylmuramoyl-L-alanine amidase